VTRILAPFGFYGWGNIGDEATLNGFASLLERSGGRAHVSVASRDPAHTRRAEPAFSYFSATGCDPRRYWAKLRASVHAIVGGTPIMDVLGKWPLCKVAPIVRATERWKVPMVFIGAGTERLRSKESVYLVAKEIAPRVRHWTVRSERDRQRLVEYGVSAGAVSVAADMAWLIPASDRAFGQDHLKRCGLDLSDPVIGVNLVNENRLLDLDPRLTTTLARSLDQVVEEARGRIVFLANEIREGDTYDRAAAVKVLERMRHKDRVVIAPNVYLTPRQMMSVVACCSLVMSMRYHFCLFSALQGIPFLALARNGKVSDLCFDLGWGACMLPSRVQVDEVVAWASRTLTSRAGACDLLISRGPEMRCRALRNLAALEALEG
jgi:polysaccharide pyruvyl transferase WcaK-like protein